MLVTVLLSHASLLSGGNGRLTSVTEVSLVSGTVPTVLVALGILAGGGLGNWLDRVLHDGHVTDFVSLGVGQLRTGIFNVADLSVVAGVAVLLLASRSDANAVPGPQP